jgi:hypothetical protein
MEDIISSLEGISIYDREREFKLLENSVKNATLDTWSLDEVRETRKRYIRYINNIDFMESERPDIYNNIQKFLELTKPSTLFSKTESFNLKNSVDTSLYFYIIAN